MSETQTIHDIAQARADNRASAEDVETEELETPEGGEPEPETDDDPDHVEDQDDEIDAAGDEPALEAPQSWPTDQLDDWDALPASVQEAWIARDNEMHRTKSDAGRETAEARRLAEDAKNRFNIETNERLKKLDTLIPAMQKRAEADYGAVDWKKLAEDDPDQYVKLKAQFDDDQKVFAEASAERQRLQQEESANFQKAQYDRLIQKNPQYAGEKGAKVLAEEARQVEQFATTLEGVTPEQLQGLSAELYEVLRDAMKFRNASKTADRPAKKPGQRTAKPTARRTASVSHQKALEAAQAELEEAKGRGRMAETAALAKLRALKRQGK